MVGVAVVGSGAWGTALAAHAARHGHGVRLWALEAGVVEDINERHENATFLRGVALPPGVRATQDMNEAISDAQLVILAPPSHHLRKIASEAARFLDPNAVVAVASKGFEYETGRLMSEVIADALPHLGRDRLAFVSGPTFAKEVAEGRPTDVVVAAHTLAGASAVQQLLHEPRFRVYTSSDPVGVQVGGAVKNVIAIAAGICDGMELGTNARAALITRGLAEMTRLGVALGANPLTFLGLAGVGDLVLTCTGPLSRNRTLGLKLAEGVDPQAYLASVRSVAEGFATSAAAHNLATQRGVDMPITEQVYHVLHHGRPLGSAVKLLMTRDFKGELAGIDPPNPH